MARRIRRNCTAMPHQAIGRFFSPEQHRSQHDPTHKEDDCWFSGISIVCPKISAHICVQPGELRIPGENDARVDRTFLNQVLVTLVYIKQYTLANRLIHLHRTMIWLSMANVPLRASSQPGQRSPRGTARTQAYRPQRQSFFRSVQNPRRTERHSYTKKYSCTLRRCRAAHIANWRKVTPSGRMVG